MFDPLSLAFRVRIPHLRKTRMGLPGEHWFHRFGWDLVEVWHKDPCSDGTDDSCIHRHGYRARFWHVWHWRLRFPVVGFLRRLTRRCADCGKRIGKKGDAIRPHEGSRQVFHPECYELRRFWRAMKEESRA